MEELIKESGLFFNFKGQYVNAPTYPGSTKRRCPDISKAQNELNYRPNISWKDGLKLTLQWYKDFFNDGSSAFETSFKKPDS